MSRIICLGNRLVAEDQAGPAVHDALLGRLPRGVELVDAGTPGLGLLNLLDGAERAVLVDAVEGFGEPGDVLRLSADEILAQASGEGGHAAGVPEALFWAQSACERPPRVVMVGIEVPLTNDAVRAAAELAVALAAPRCEEI